MCDNVQLQSKVLTGLRRKDWNYGIRMADEWFKIFITKNIKYNLLVYEQNKR